MVPFDYYDLKLDHNKLKQLEVTTSPIISEQSRAKLQSILDQYLPGTPVKNSVLSSLFFILRDIVFIISQN